MADETEALTNALLALSGTSGVPEARTALLNSISSESLKDIAGRCVRDHLSREVLELLVCNVLDYIDETRKHIRGAPTTAEAGEANPKRELLRSDGNRANGSSSGSRRSNEWRFAVSTPQPTATPAQLKAGVTTSTDLHMHDEPGPTNQARTPIFEQEQAASKELDHIQDSAEQEPHRTVLLPANNVELKFLFRIVSPKFGTGRSVWYDKLGVYRTLQQYMMDKFTRDYIASSAFAGHDRNIMDGIHDLLDEYQCLDLYLNSRAAERCTFMQSDHKTGFACDGCIERRRLCIRPIQRGLKKGEDLVVNPLPKKLRLDRIPAEMSYWVRGS